MSEHNQSPHEKIEKNVGLMAVLIAVAISFGGLLYLGGMLLMAWNVWMTTISGASARAQIPSVAATHAA